MVASDCGPASDGVYICGSVEEVPVVFTVDTGATRTIVSDEVYFHIPEERRPCLSKPKRGVRTANGGRLVAHGIGTFELRLGESRSNGNYW